jgi:hypothetical protein
MRPAITEVQVYEIGDEQRANVVGPIDLEVPGSENAESEIYFWVRVASDAPREESGGGEQAGKPAEGIGTSEMELDEPATTGQTASTASAPTTWSADVPVKDGKLVVGAHVFVEAWALIRTKNRHREFQVYWYDDDVEVVKGTRPRDSAAE